MTPMVSREKKMAVKKKNTRDEAAKIARLCYTTVVQRVGAKQQQSNTAGTESVHNKIVVRTAVLLFVLSCTSLRFPFLC